jgi:hypothetical protein
MVMRGDNCVIQTNGHDHAPFLASSILTVTGRIEWFGSCCAELCALYGAARREAEQEAPR